MVVKRLGIAVVLGFTLISGCGQHSTADVASVSTPPPLPPQIDCAVPKSESELAAEFASIAYKVIVADPAAPQPQMTPLADSSTQYVQNYPIDNVDVLAGNDASLPKEIVALAAKDTNMLPPGHYVIFLNKLPNGDATFARGLRGTFLVDDTGLARRRCANYADPSRPILSDDSIETSTLGAWASSMIAADNVSTPK